MKKLVSETRVWFGSLGWAMGYVVAWQYPKHGWIVFALGLVSYLFFYLTLAIVLELKYGNK